MIAPDLPTGAELTRLREVAEVVATEAGRLIVSQRPDRVAVAATKSSPTDVVTAMDHAAEQLLIGRLQELRPEDGFLGEESGFRPGRSGLTWVVDPIDGTVNYLYGLPSYAVSVALVAGAEPTAEPDPRTWQALVGCVHAPALGETWSAARGQGARLAESTGTRDLAGPASPGLAEALVATGFGYSAPRRRRQAEVVLDLLPRIRDLRRTGVASLDLCAVAAGRVDGYYERGLNAWDFAGALVVARETGAVVTDFAGGEPHPGGLLAAGAGLHRVLLDALLSAGVTRED
ncbi:inositol monophosphatase family protein [Kineococcus gynurae]|uniref:Inositol-1-monophosphatase n=1 Tax=Kineococcus gynurae TaxID=452979 RepID=A0ABV5LV62_9ACTN